MLSVFWPLAALQLTTSRLVLRYPSEAELAVLAGVAAAGVHAPGQRPYLTPWTEGTAVERGLHVVRQHWSRRGGWTTADWALELGIFLNGEPVGMVALRAHDFAVLREVKTETWLGLNFHRRGLGTEARAAVLHLAFAELGAASAVSEVFQDNAASQGVSRRLGYRHDGISRDVRDGSVVVSDRLRLDRVGWFDLDRPSTAVSGMEDCLPFFGV